MKYIISIGMLLMMLAVVSCYSARQHDGDGEIAYPNYYSIEYVITAGEIVVEDRAKAQFRISHPPPRAMYVSLKDADKNTFTAIVESRVQARMTLTDPHGIVIFSADGTLGGDDFQVTDAWKVTTDGTRYEWFTQTMRVPLHSDMEYTLAICMSATKPLDKSTALKVRLVSYK